jgi:peptide/nickel transport system substrate-binding protein
MAKISVRPLSIIVMAVFLLFWVPLAWKTNTSQAFYRSGSSEPTDTLDPATYRISAVVGEIQPGIWSIYLDSRFYDSVLQRDLYPSLFRQTEYMRLPVPSLAVDFPTEMVKEGDYWVSTVDLKQEVKWSDGSSVAAQDVAFTYETVKWMGIHYLREDFSLLDKVEALTPYTVKFYFNSVTGWTRWPNSIGLIPLAPSRYWSTIVDTAKTQPDPLEWLHNYRADGEPTCGPYKLSRWEPGLVEQVADPLYFFKGLQVVEYSSGAYQEMLPGIYEFNAYGSPAGDIALQYVYGPYASRVKYTTYESLEDSLEALKANQVDTILDVYGLSLIQYENLSTKPGISLLKNEMNANRILGINLNRFPLDHPEVRKAIDILVDREFISEIASEEHKIAIKPIYSFISEDNKYWYWPTERRGEGLSRRERIEQAVSLLKEAGFTWTSEPGWDELAGKSIPGTGLSLGEVKVPELELLTPDLDPIRVSAARLISEWLMDVGIPVHSNPMEFEALVGQVFTERNFDIYFVGFSVTDLPDSWCGIFHSSEDYVGGSNAGGYSNPELDAICDSFSQETDLEIMHLLGNDFQQILIADLPAIPVFSPTLLEAYRGDRVIYPFKQVLGGLYSHNGMTSLVKFVPVIESIPEAGGVLNAPGALVSFPPEIFDAPVEVTFEIQPPSGSLPAAGFHYQISAVYADTGQPAQPLPGMRYTITVAYDENALPPGVNEATLQLYYWDTATSSFLAEQTSQVDTDANLITATPDHFSLWGVFCRYSIYMPYLFP